MASAETTRPRLPFQPRPGCDDLLSVLLLWRLSERVLATEGGCWEWTGARTSAGYGSIEVTSKHTGRVTYVHRLVAALCVSDVPAGAFVLHHCDNPACCRPDHLFVGTQQDNVADMDAKGRRVTVAPRGEAVGSARMTAEKVRQMRRQFRDGHSLGSLAREFGISHRQVKRIVQRLTWRHVQ